MPGPVGQLASSCASFHRKWTLKLARAVAARFVAAVPRYLTRKGLEAFAATTFDGRWVLLGRRAWKQLCRQSHVGAGVVWGLLHVRKCLSTTGLRAGVGVCRGGRCMLPS